MYHFQLTNKLIHFSLFFMFSIVDPVAALTKNYFSIQIVITAASSELLLFIFLWCRNTLSQRWDMAVLIFRLQIADKIQESSL